MTSQEAFSGDPGTGARRRRDEGLRRLARATRTVGVSSFVLAGALAGYLGLARPARHSGVPTTNGAPTSSSATDPSVGAGSTAESNRYGGSTLRPSFDDPSTASASPRVTSGAT